MNEFKISPIEKNGQRVLTTAQLAEAYETDSRIISNNFNRNSNRYVEGKHYYRLTGKALKEFKTNHQIDESLIRVNVLYLWTERGALLHAKSLNTEKAWEVYEFLVDNYFHTRKMIASDNDFSVQVIGKLELLERKIDMLEKEINTLEKNSKNRADDIIKTLFDMSNNVIATGFEFIYNHFFK